MALQLLVNCHLLESSEVSNDAPKQSRSRITLPDGGTEMLLHPSKLRVGSLLQVRVPEQEATPGEPPQVPAATEEQKVRPVVATDKGAFFLDTTGKIVSSQPHCAGYFGRQPEELVGLDLKDFLKPDYAQVFTEALETGRKGGVQSFQAVALRKDGSEFLTQLTLKFLHGTIGFCWTVFVQAPPGHAGEVAHIPFNAGNGSEAQPSGETTPTVATTETVTLGQTPEPETAEKPAAEAEAYSRLAAGFTGHTGHEAAKRSLQVQKDYRESAAGVEQELQSLRVRAEENETARKLLVADLERVRNSNKLLRKKEEELNDQLQKLQAAVEQAEARAGESATQSKDWEKKAADFRKNIDELTRAQTAGQGADTQFATRRVKELEEQLKDANARAAAAKTRAEKLEAENRQLNEANTTTRADLDQERDAIKVAQQIAEGLNTQIQKLRGAAEQAEARASESAAQAKDWEQKAAALKQTVDELTCSRDADKNADAQSAQRIKELEQQLNEANAVLAETNTKSKADLEKERDFKELWLKEKEELNAQLQKLRDAAEQAGARAEESAAQSRNWEQKAADLKKRVDELARSHAETKTADAQSAQRIKELEQQLNEANANLAETNTKSKADLERERDAKELWVREKEELNAQLEKLKSAAEQAEAHASENAAQARDWEKKAAALKQTVDELTRSQTAGKNINAQSAQRVGQLEEQLRDASASVTAAKTQAEKLEAEIRELKEANTKTNAALEMERDAHKLFRQKSIELNTRVQKFQEIAEQAEARAAESAAQSRDWEKKAAELKQTVDELTRSHEAGKNTDAQSAKRFKELEQQLEDANAILTAGRAEAEKQNSARQRLETENRSLAEANAQATADLEKERDAKKLLEREKEELNAQLQKVKSAAEQAEARARESAAESKDWEKKAADFKKSVEELTRSLAVEKSATAQSAERVEELEQRLEDANASLTAAGTEAEKQNSARQRLEAENRNLAEANAQAKADLKQEREFKKLSEKEKEKLYEQLQKVESAAEQTEAQSKDWEKKAAELKKSVEELTRTLAAERNAAAQSAQRVKELEQRLDDANASLIAGRTEGEELNSARERLEMENRNLAEANAQAKTDLKQEREFKRLSEKEKEKLYAQLQKVESAAEQAEARARVSAAQSKEWQKRADDLEKNVEELARNLAAEKNVAAQSAQRVAELEQQVKRAVEDLAVSKAEALANRYPARLEARKCTVTADATVWTELLQSAAREAMLEEKVAKLEEHLRKVEGKRAENRAPSAAAKFDKLKEKFKAAKG